MAATHTDPSMTRHVRQAWPDLSDLFAAGEEIQRLVESFGWTLLCDVVDREVRGIDEDLDGRLVPLSQAEYALAHGRRNGLLGFKRAAEAIVVTAAREREKQQARHEADGESSAGR